MAVETSRSAPAMPPAAKGLERKDSWWWSPLGFVALFSAFGLWVTFRAFENAHYSTLVNAAALFQGQGLDIPNYLSPLYSPTLDPHLIIAGWHVSPAIYILIFPLSFRLTCYYYRKQIYRGYLADPVACAVPEPGPLANMRFKKYTGERAFPFIAMNFHRFAFYAAAVFIVLLWKDTIDAFFFQDANGHFHFGVHVGSLVFLINILLLTAYTFSCHSWRHLIGGSTDCYSCSVTSKTRYGMWTKISFLNEKHGLWAMLSLVSVALTDVYVFLATSGLIKGAWV